MFSELQAGNQRLQDSEEMEIMKRRFWTYVFSRLKQASQVFDQAEVQKYIKRKKVCWGMTIMQVQ